MSESKLKIIPAKILNPAANDNVIFMAEENESTGLHISHIPMVGSMQFGISNPLTSG